MKQEQKDKNQRENRGEGARVKPEEKTEGLRRSMLELLQLMAFVLAAIVICFTFFFALVGVDGSSMYPTLHDGDMMLVRRIAYTPAGGDVVVLQKEDAFDGRALVKRVIATGGQTVYIDYEANTVTVDGVTLEEPYINAEYDSYYADDVMAVKWDLDPQYIDAEFTVPEGCIFVCGDNRNHSSDSRVEELGMVDERCVIGEVLLVLFPFQDIGLVD